MPVLRPTPQRKICFAPLPDPRRSLDLLDDGDDFPISRTLLKLPGRRRASKVPIRLQRQQHRRQIRCRLSLARCLVQ